MAEVSAERQQQQQPEISLEGQKLKYLDFVHLAALQAVVCFSRLYEFSKESSGPLKPGVQAVEDTVKTVVGPVYEKLHDVPFELLKFVDRKVDESVSELERHLPRAVKEASSQAYSAGVVGTATGLAKTAVAKVEPTAKELYSRYEPVAEAYAASAWRALNRLPLFRQVAEQIVVPTAAYWSDKYNGAVCYSAEKGYAVASYLPLVPTERIAKVFAADNNAAQAGAAPAAAQ